MQITLILKFKKILNKKKNKKRRTEKSLITEVTLVNTDIEDKEEK